MAPQREAATEVTSFPAYQVTYQDINKSYLNLQKVQAVTAISPKMKEINEFLEN